MDLFLELSLIAAATLISVFAGWLLGKVLNDLDLAETDSRYQSYCASFGGTVLVTLIGFWYSGPTGLWWLLSAAVIFPLVKWAMKICTPKHNEFERHFAEVVDCDLQWLCAISAGVAGLVLAVATLKYGGFAGILVTILGLSWLVVPVVASGIAMLFFLAVAMVFFQGIPNLAKKLTSLGESIAQSISGRRQEN